MAQAVKPIQLKPETVQAFEAYIREAELAMEQTLRDGPFLWSDANPKHTIQVAKGEIVAQFWSGSGPGKVPEGLIHDWIGACFIPDATIPDTLQVVQDYNNHENVYKPEVIASKLISRNGDDFQIYYRLLKKKIITVVLDTYHDVHYAAPDPARALCRSYTTCISEVEHPGTPKEEVLPPDTGFGFLWRLYSYWRFQARDGGVYVECRDISLTRNIPLALRWIIQPIVKELPRDSLLHTLEATRGALIRHL
jgi:hypothetical protein